ncbi:uncharacterized protein LOC104883811 [Beta vulgaris subsp. vulgaris]|uniref:uncharacterized protein LOC104883811 n=1 Tax=Beta vulgaris subsp. vulgaris TaxID=3555 RepID=UPI00053FBA6A|nr:uncharacterized protein LOC104883811 [Beta vulgaris subsp. vulgaris]
MAPFEALYGRKCRSPICWNDFSENVVLVTKFMEETVKNVLLIQNRIQAAQDRQKSYVDLKRREAVGDKVFLKVSPTKGMMRFGKKGKLCAKYVASYEILQRIGKVAYKLALLMEFEKMHDVFHICQLKRYIPDKSHVLERKRIQIDRSFTYEERPVRILDKKVRSTHNKNVNVVKVLWSNHESEEATWEGKDEMKKKYPKFFLEGMPKGLLPLAKDRSIGGFHQRLAVGD